MDATELAMFGEVNRNLAEIRKTQMSQGEAIARVETNTELLPDRVTKLERRGDRQDGERKAFAIIGGVAGSIVTTIFGGIWHYVSGR